MTHSLLMIEDDFRLAGMVVAYLAQNGFAATHVGTVGEGMAHLAAHPVDMVLLDLMLPDGDGLSACKAIQQQHPGQAIVILTAKGDPMDRVVGLELGADDYVPKPFEPRELLARLRAVLRRHAGSRNAVASAPGAIQRFGRLSIDADTRSVMLDEQPCLLTAYQFDLLLAMSQRAGRVLSRDVLMGLVKGEALESFDRSIDVHIGRIRAAIEDDTRHPRRIITVRSAGYVFAKVQDA